MGQNILRNIEQAKKRTFWQEHLKSWQSSLMTAKLIVGNRVYL